MLEPHMKQEATCTSHIIVVSKTAGVQDSVS